MIERINKNIFIFFIDLSGNIKEIIKKFIFKEVERLWITKGDVHIVNSLSGMGRKRREKIGRSGETKRKKLSTVWKKWEQVVHRKLITFGEYDIIPDMEVTAEKIREYAEKIAGEYGETFGNFRDLLLKYNQNYNLTAITEEKEVFYKHFLDSVAGESLFPHGSRVVEVGSGAGFPSLPLKIVRSDLSFTLVESTRKKCDFLRAAVDNLGLSGVEVLCMRAEDAGKDRLWRESFDVCCARAVARTNTLAEYCLPLVRVGGRWIAYKGHAEEEAEEAARAVRLLGGSGLKRVEYELPEGYGQRTLLFCEKSRPTPAAYPRGNGRERRTPL